MQTLLDALSRAFTIQGIGPLLGEPFVQRALLAAALLGVLAGLLAPLVVVRNMAFAVHGTSELATAGAALALLVGASVTTGALGGAVAASLVFGLLGGRARDRDSAIGVVLAFGLGLGVLFLSLSTGRVANKFGLLVGQLVSVDAAGLRTLAACLVAVVAALVVFYRPLLFASCDPRLAQARGVPTALLDPLFAVMIGVTVAFAVQVVGAILVLAVMVTPGAAASRVTARPWLAVVLSVAFAETALVGGLILSLAPGLPTSPYVTSISFAIYLACRALGRARRHRSIGRVATTHPDTTPPPTTAPPTTAPPTMAPLAMARPRPGDPAGAGPVPAAVQQSGRIPARVQESGRIGAPRSASHPFSER